jgi:hypothetical protein
MVETNGRFGNSHGLRHQEFGIGYWTFHVPAVVEERPEFGSSRLRAFETNAVHICQLRQHGGK